MIKRILNQTVNSLISIKQHITPFGYDEMEPSCPVIDELIRFTSILSWKF